MGIRNSTYRGLKKYDHTGGHEAFITDLSYFPNQDLGIITISNFGDEGRLSGSKIADLLLGEFMSPEEVKKRSKVKIEKDKLEQFMGLYLNTNLNGAINLTIENDIIGIIGIVFLVLIVSVIGLSGVGVEWMEMIRLSLH